MLEGPLLGPVVCLVVATGQPQGLALQALQGLVGLDLADVLHQVPLDGVGDAIDASMHLAGLAPQLHRGLVQ